jgi:hypothetical protein
VHELDPLARQVGNSREVRREPLSFEAGHLARRCCVTVSRCPANNPTYRRIVAQALGVVHVLISSKAAEHRLPQQTDQRMAAVPAGSRISEYLARYLGQPTSSRYANNPASDVTTDPTGASGGG